MLMRFPILQSIGLKSLSDVSIELLKNLHSSMPSNTYNLTVRLWLTQSGEMSRIYTTTFPTQHANMFISSSFHPILTTTDCNFYAHLYKTLQISPLNHYSSRQRCSQTAASAGRTRLPPGLRLTVVLTLPRTGALRTASSAASFSLLERYVFLCYCSMFLVQLLKFWLQTSLAIFEVVLSVCDNKFSLYVCSCCSSGKHLPFRFSVDFWFTASNNMFWYHKVTITSNISF